MARVVVTGNELRIVCWPFAVVACTASTFARLVEAVETSSAGHFVAFSSINEHSRLACEHLRHTGRVSSHFTRLALHCLQPNFDFL